MWEAIDRSTGLLVRAPEGLRGVLYQCPSPKCGGDVYLRRGQYYESHFAHLPGEGKDDCENYFPGSELGGTTFVRPDVVQAKDRPTWERPDLHLERQWGRYNLSIVMPVVRHTDAWTGAVSYSDRKGTRTFVRRHLESRRSFPVLPSTDAYRFRLQGDIPEQLKGVFDAGIAGLKDGVSVFKWADSSGRRVRRNEALVWGGHYWILCAAGSRPLGAFDDLFKPLPAVDGWLLYEVVLPTWDISQTWANLRRELLEESLGQKIRPPGAQVWIVSPFPIRSEHDLWAFPFEKRMLVAVTGRAAYALAVVDEDGNEQEAKRVNEAEPALWELSIPKPGLYSVYLGQTLVAPFTAIDPPHALFKPSDIEISSSAGSWLLVDSQAPLTEHRLSGQAVEALVLGPAEVVRHAAIRVNGEAFAGQDLAEIFNDASRDLDIDAGIYGRVRIARRVAPVVPKAIPAAYLQQGRWLLSLPPPRLRESTCSLPQASELPDQLLELATRRWSSRYLPHVISFWNNLNGRT